MAGENRTGRVKKISATRSRGPRPAWRRRQARRPRGAGAGCGAAPPRADPSGSDGRSSRPSPASTSRSCATAERTPSAPDGHRSAAGCTCRYRSPPPTPAREGVRGRAPRADAGRGGAGVPWRDPGRGIRAAWHARGRRGHEDGGVRERGLSGTVREGWPAPRTRPPRVTRRARQRRSCGPRPRCPCRSRRRPRPGGTRGPAAGLQPGASRAPARPGGNCPVPPLQTS